MFSRAAIRCSPQDLTGKKVITMVALRKVSEFEAREGKRKKQPKYMIEPDNKAIRGEFCDGREARQLQRRFLQQVWCGQPKPQQVLLRVWKLTAGGDLFLLQSGQPTLCKFLWLVRAKTQSQGIEPAKIHRTTERDWGMEPRAGFDPATSRLRGGCSWLTMASTG